ncbi:FGGY family carbohydrate kinase, partial [Streptomyces milbemycinicus]
MVERYVISIDQGTLSTRCILFDQQGRLVSVAQREHEQYYAKPGWAEHDPTEIWSHLRRTVVPRALEGAGVGPDRITAIGIANQRETTVVWDRRTGVPVCHAITWQDTRTSGYVERLRRTTGDDFFLERCGLSPTTYFSAPRLRWLFDHVEGLRARAERGEVLFGTMESWLIWNLTGGPDGGLHLTDATNASRTML